MCISQDNIAASNCRLDFFHAGWRRIVIHRDEAALLVIAISFLVGKVSTKTMGQITNPVILNRSDNAATSNDLVGKILDEVGQGVESCFLMF